MIYSKDGMLGIEGDFSEILADMFLIMEHFTEITTELKEENDNIDPMIRDAFETFPETVTEFTKIFVKATH